MASASASKATDDPYRIVAKGIKHASEQYVEEYWKRKTGEPGDKNNDENKCLETLVEFIKERRPQAAADRSKEDKSKDESIRQIREMLDIVAKHNMSTYYNMLLPKAVCTSFFVR